MKPTVESKALPEVILRDTIVFAYLDAVMVEHPEPDIVSIVVPMGMVSDVFSEGKTGGGGKIYQE
jgi:hypothetical protein